MLNKDKRMRGTLGVEYRGEFTNPNQVKIIKIKYFRWCDKLNLVGEYKITL